MKRKKKSSKDKRNKGSEEKHKSNELSMEDEGNRKKLKSKKRLRREIPDDSM